MLGRRDDHVLGREVAVDDAFGVRLGQAVRELGGELQYEREREPGAGQHLIEARALDVLRMPCPMEPIV